MESSKLIGHSDLEKTQTNTTLTPPEPVNTEPDKSKTLKENIDSASSINRNEIHAGQVLSTDVKKSQQKDISMISQDKPNLNIGHTNISPQTSEKQTAKKDIPTQVMSRCERKSRFDAPGKSQEEPRRVSLESSQTSKAIDTNPCVKGQEETHEKNKIGETFKAPTKYLSSQNNMEKSDKDASQHESDSLNKYQRGRRKSLPDQYDEPTSNDDQKYMKRKYSLTISPSSDSNDDRASKEVVGARGQKRPKESSPSKTNKITKKPPFMDER